MTLVLNSNPFVLCRVVLLPILDSLDFIFKSSDFFLSFLIFFKHLFIIERQRVTEHEHGRGRERRRHRIRSRLQALSCQHRAWYGARTHKLRSGAEPKLVAQPTEPPRHPSSSSLSYWSLLRYDWRCTLSPTVSTLSSRNRVLLQIGFTKSF